MRRRPPRPTLFPYPTLSRSVQGCQCLLEPAHRLPVGRMGESLDARLPQVSDRRSEEHTSELQSRSDLVCRLLLEQNTNSTCSDPCTVSSAEHLTATTTSSAL